MMVILAIVNKIIGDGIGDGLSNSSPLSLRRFQDRFM